MGIEVPLSPGLMTGLVSRTPRVRELQEKAAQELLVTTVEDIIRAEPQIFWSSRELKPDFNKHPATIARG